MWFQKVSTFITKITVVTDNLIYVGQGFNFNDLEMSRKCIKRVIPAALQFIVLYSNIYIASLAA